ncbi:rod shape-determining protein [Acaryochloris sp. IP29b_bin.137]|uniref:rod shape-determining protein n=1 Tax=Acaryochloris sp. IP29b_bin.137 TaxID=2969217 RepID=UPI0026330E0B|nr:rod shape-determining protein [Acaryochloris sp. IP29b_bin.137]
MNLVQRLMGIFSEDLLIELTKSEVSITSFSNGATVKDKPLIAVSGEKNKLTVEGVGAECQNMSKSGLQFINPFDHSRSFVANFTYAEKILRHLIRKLLSNPLITSPRVIMHQLEKNEGGLTEIEERVLRELALGAGAREVIVFQGSKINTSVDTYQAIKQRVDVT